MIDRTPTILATTFRRDEVEAVCTLLGKAMAGGDVAILSRQPSVASAYGKLLRLREKAERGET